MNTPWTKASSLTLFASLSLASSTCPSLLAATTPELPIGSKPNILFILADDAGYGDFGCYGQKTIQTPNIDHFAQQGVRFLQFYAGAPVCAPSRNTLMTGQHTGHTQFRGNAKINLR